MPMFKKLIDFSPEGEFLAYSSPDGCLKVWETSSNTLKQEYTPSSHLSATCSTISWCPQDNVVSPNKSKKIRNEVRSSGLSDLQLIGMGTLTGDILLYSYVKADLHSVLKNGHTGIVNDISWCRSAALLYSCSSDQHIIVWDVCNGKVKTKWKADNVAIHSICVIDDSNLLSASNSIRWWDVKKTTVLKKFTGHATPIYKLLPIRKNKDVDSCYFLSAAFNDRIINAWQLKGEKNKSVASFVLSDEAEQLHLIQKENKSVTLSAVCKDGTLLLFEHVLNGTLKKPIQAKCTLQVAKKSSEPGGKPQRVPVLATHLSRNLDFSLISYGNFIKPSFERIDLSTVSNEVFLVRDSLVSNISQTQNVTKIKHPDKSNHVKLLAPGHMMPVKDVQSIPQKRKKRDEPTELSVEEHLKTLDLSRIPAKFRDKEPSVKADSLVHLILQGLQSNNRSMLGSVLECADDEVINTTIKRLPIQCIILFLKVIKERLKRKENQPFPSLKWLKGILSFHLPYLMSCKNVDEHLGPLSQLIEARIENFPKMCQLQGCLSVLLSQASTRSKCIDRDSDTHPLAVYQSDSSEDSDMEGDDLASNVDDELHSNVGNSTTSSSEDSANEMDS